MKPGARLKRAIEAGGMLALFALFEEWSTRDLQALLKEADAFASGSGKEIDELWKTFILKPEVFFSKVLSEKSDRARYSAHFEITTSLAEICSVAIYYLERRGVKVEGIDEVEA